MIGLINYEVDEYGIKVYEVGDLKKQGLFASDIIQQDFIQYLVKNQQVRQQVMFLELAMGTGKTRLILGDIASELCTFKRRGICRKPRFKMLVLSPRKVLKEQQRTDYNKLQEIVSSFDIELDEKPVEIWCYQQLQCMIKNTTDMIELFNRFDLIVFDETHLLYSDSAFNENTQKVYNLLIKEFQGILVLLSATGDIVFDDMLIPLVRKGAEVHNFRSRINFNNYEKIHIGSEIACLDYVLDCVQQGKTVFLCVERIFGGNTTGIPINSIAKSLLDMSEDIDLKVMVSDDYVEQRINVFQDTTYITKIKDLRKPTENKIMPSQVYLTTSICNAGVEFYGCQVGEEIKPIDVVYVDFPLMTDVLQGIARVRESEYQHLQDVEVMIKSYETNSISGKKQSLINMSKIHKDSLDWYYEWLEFGTYNKLQQFIRENNSDTNIFSKYSDAIYYDFTHNRIEINNVVLARLHYTIGEYEEILRGAEKVDNSTSAYREYVKAYLREFCGCLDGRFNTLYSEKREEIVDDVDTVGQVLREEYESEDSLVYSPRSGEYVGKIIAIEDSERLELAKKIGCINSRKEFSTYPKLMNEKLEKLGLSDIWEFRSVQIKINGKKRQALVLINK